MSGPNIYTSIFARNCRVEKIFSTQASEFLEANHPFGWSKCRHCYALVLEKAAGSIRVGTVVAVSCFSNARRWKKGDNVVSSYEWVRYASLRGTRVLGGMGKTLSAFIAEHHPDDVMTYAPVMPCATAGPCATEACAPETPCANAACAPETPCAGQTSGADLAADGAEMPGEAYLKLGFVLEGEKKFGDSRSLKFRLTVKKP